MTHSIDGLIRSAYTSEEATDSPRGLEVRVITQWLQVVHGVVVDHEDVAGTCQTQGLLVGTRGPAARRRVSLSVRTLDRLLAEINAAR